MKTKDYLEVNKANWNARVDGHLESDFYDLKSFKETKNSLKHIELKLLGDINNKSILHLQCHFGQDSMSMRAMGASVTGVDSSNEAIKEANLIAEELSLECQFIECDILSLREVYKSKHDVVFTSYGTIGWLPDIDKWANVIAESLNSGGEFIMVDFHPFVWTFDDDVDKITYRYFNSGPIDLIEEETYTGDVIEKKSTRTISWNHSLSEIITALLKNGIEIVEFEEYDYSTYDCFSGLIEEEKEKFRFKHLGNKIPMMYSIVGRKK